MILQFSFSHCALQPWIHIYSYSDNRKSVKEAFLSVHKTLIQCFTALSLISKSTICENQPVWIHTSTSQPWVCTVCSVLHSSEFVQFVVCFIALSLYSLYSSNSMYVHKALIVYFTALSSYRKSRVFDTSLCEFTQSIDSVLHSHEFAQQE